MKHSSFGATISALDAKTSAIVWRSFDTTISALNQSGKVILPTDIDISHMSAHLYR